MGKLYIVDKLDYDNLSRLVDSNTLVLIKDTRIKAHISKYIKNDIKTYTSVYTDIVKHSMGRREFIPDKEYELLSTKMNIHSSIFSCYKTIKSEAQRYVSNYVGVLKCSNILLLEVESLDHQDYEILGALSIPITAVWDPSKDIFNFSGEGSVGFVRKFSESRNLESTPMNAFSSGTSVLRNLDKKSIQSYKVETSDQFINFAQQYSDSHLGSKTVFIAKTNAEVLSISNSFKKGLSNCRVFTNKDLKIEEDNEFLLLKYLLHYLRNSVLEFPIYKLLGDLFIGKEVSFFNSEIRRNTQVLLQDLLNPDYLETGNPYGKMKFPLVVFDTETTGFSYGSDIIQLSAVRIDSTGRVLEEFDRYIYTDQSLESTKDIHNITESILREKGEPKEKVLTDFIRFIGTDNLVGHNVFFDKYMLETNIMMVGLKPITNKFYDTLEMASRIIPDVPNHKLEYLGEYFKVTHKSTHNALDDVKATAQVFMNLLYRFNPEVLFRMHPWVKDRLFSLSKFVELKQNTSASILEFFRSYINISEQQLNSPYFRELERIDNSGLSILARAYRMLEVKSKNLVTSGDIIVTTYHGSYYLDIDNGVICNFSKGIFPDSRNVEKDVNLVNAIISNIQKEVVFIYKGAPSDSILGGDDHRGF